MTKLKNLLRCYVSGMGIRSFSSTFHISRNTLRKYMSVNSKKVACPWSKFCRFQMIS